MECGAMPCGNIHPNVEQKGACFGLHFDIKGAETSVTARKDSNAQAVYLSSTKTASNASWSIEMDSIHMLIVVATNYASN